MTKEEKTAIAVLTERTDNILQCLRDVKKDTKHISGLRVQIIIHWALITAEFTAFLWLLNIIIERF